MQMKRVRLKEGYLPWRLALVGVCCFGVAILRADEPPAAPAPDGTSTPDTAPTSSDEQQKGPDPTTTPTSNPSPNSQNNDNSGSPNSDNTPNGPSAPNTPGPGDTTNPNSPLLPSQGLNTSPLYTSPDSNGGQPSQLSAPALYNTGAFDLSQVAANNALAQAFMQTGVVSSEQTPDQGPGPLDRIRLGPVDIKTTLDLSVISDDNIYADSSHRVSDIEFGITPAILVDYGTHEGQKGYASIVYAPTLNRFYHQSSQDSDNQNVALNLQYPFQRLTLNATETYTQVTGVNLDSRTRTTQSTNVATVGGNYDVDDKLALQVHFEQLNTSYSGNDDGSATDNGSGSGSDANNTGGLDNDSRSTIETAANYRITDKLTLGPGFNIGIEKPEDSVQQTFEQALVNVNYQATEKISFFGQGGIEFRQYEHGDDKTNPVFSAGITYAPTENASFSLSGYQNVEPTSDDSSQTDVNTGVAATASERLFQRFVLGFSFIYAHTEYSDNGGTATTERGFNPNGSSQDNLVYRPSLTFEATQWTAVALYYQYQDNESNAVGGSYHDNQFGLSISAKF
jgi:hypothetical protein